MKPVASSMILVGGLLTAVACVGGCEHKDAQVQYDSKVDSLMPTYYTAAPDTGILDDQRAVFAKMRDANAAAHPAVPASAPATAPATAPDAGSPPAPPA